MTDSPSPASVNALPLPSPVRRNWLWWSMQVMLQSVITLWLNYRSRGLENLPDEGGALLLINHRSFLDPLLAGIPIDRPVCFVARHNLFNFPGVGWVFRKNYAVPINRDAAGTASLREIVRRLEHGFLVGMFPEGTRHSGSEPLGRLKPGFVSILRRAQVPVIPVGIAGASEVMPKGSIVLRPRPVRVVIGKRIPVSQLTALTARGHKQELLALIASRMSESVIEAEEWLSEVNHPLPVHS